MDVLTVAGVGKALGNVPRSLVTAAVEQLQDPALIVNTNVDGALEVLLDRVCLSLAVAKPVGLRSWAERESKRFGASGAAEIASAACHAIAAASRFYDVDRSRLLGALEGLKTEIERTLGPLHARDESDGRIDTVAVDVLLSMLSERDNLTCCHSRATGQWARRVGVAMGLTEDALDFVERSAVLHDVGKVSTPDAILNKPGPLTPQEWTIMRDHAAAGQRILEKVPALTVYGPIVRAHHERYDGLGYPDRTAGIDIPFEARLIAVADSFHAMISDRPYRKAIAPRAALAILREGRGAQWDPDVVDAMLSLFERTSSRSERPVAMPEQRTSTA